MSATPIFGGLLEAVTYVAIRKAEDNLVLTEFYGCDFHSFTDLKWKGKDGQNEIQNR